MGLVAGRGLRAARDDLRPPLLAFGLIMPPIGAVFGLLAGLLIGLSPGGLALLMTLSASASYIAVPAAMRVALPDANPSIYLTLSLGVTFPVQPDPRHPGLSGRGAGRLRRMRHADP